MDPATFLIAVAAAACGLVALLGLGRLLERALRGETGARWPAQEGNRACRPHVDE